VSPLISYFTVSRFQTNRGSFFGADRLDGRTVRVQRQNNETDMAAVGRPAVYYCCQKNFKRPLLYLHCQPPDAQININTHLGLKSAAFRPEFRKHRHFC